MTKVVDRIYLDHAATTPIRPSVALRIAELAQTIGNPSSVHREGRAARKVLEESRAAVAAAVGASPEDVIFTSGGTEANDLALGAAARRAVLVSAIEHASVLEAVADAPRVAVDGDGLLELQALEELLERCRPDLVSVMLVNNETGVTQDIPAIAQFCRAAGALLHVDAVQALGKLPARLAELGCDLLTISAHKIGGPAGVGALVVRDDAPVAPRLKGGGQEGRRRAGTQNLLGIAGFAEAIRLLDPAEAERCAELRRRLEERVLSHCRNTRIAAYDAPRAPHIINLITPGSAAELQVIRLDLAGVAVSAGAACSSGKVGASHVLAAMGQDAACGIRVSLGWTTTAAEVDRFADIFCQMQRLSEKTHHAAPSPLPNRPVVAT